MKSITIKGQVREIVGKKSTKALRNAEQVPCVVYGGEKGVQFSAPSKSFRNLVYTADALTATIELEGQEPIMAILQDIQFHPVTDKILHIDFYQLHTDKEVVMEIPTHLVGNAIGVMNGGSLSHNLRKLRVKALPGNLPDSIEGDISDLKIGMKLTVGELAKGDFTFMHNDNVVLAQVKMSRNATKEDEEGEEGEEGEATEGEATEAAE
ncbi:MAG: 50S ribosomal protein L25/general stress protein Ctc [Flavobacteriales bacterium]|nr:50S ribosomal protein L25/general stress protein Ctc [Flavobacteriales bacterium]